MKLDPAPTKPQYDEWAKTATRPLTQAAIGVSSVGRRTRCANLSALWTPERSLRMFRRPKTEPQDPEDGGDLGVLSRRRSRRCQRR